MLDFLNVDEDFNFSATNKSTTSNEKATPSNTENEVFQTERRRP